VPPFRSLTGRIATKQAVVYALKQLRASIAGVIASVGVLALIGIFVASDLRAPDIYAVHRVVCKERGAHRCYMTLLDDVVNYASLAFSFS
jgi:hypothetical protein